MNKYITFIMLLLTMAIYLPEMDAHANESEQLSASCTSWDIKDLCCPGYCAAKNSNKWSSADAVFAGCLSALTCKPGYTSGFMACGTCK